jgi:hypothetical protein
MSRAELEAWLRLLNLEFSPSKVRALVAQFGTVEGVWSAKPSAWSEVPGLRPADVVALERALQEPLEVPPRASERAGALAAGERPALPCTSEGATRYAHGALCVGRAAGARPVRRQHRGHAQSQLLRQDGGGTARP